MKTCSKCKEIKPDTAFHRSGKTKNDGYRYDCKLCHRIVANTWSVSNKEQKAKTQKNWRISNPNVRSEDINRRKKATPSWAIIDNIKLIYTKAKSLDLQVDHIVPLNSKVVCGLHCEDNLQLLTLRENASKGNRYWPCM